MSFVVTEALEDYALENTSTVPDLLEELRVYTYEHMEVPQMQVGSIEGNFLRMLVRMTQAKTVVEVGTFTGYSTLMMASGLPEDGRLITHDVDPECTRVARSFFDRSPHGHKITIKLGSATETLAQLNEPIDMAFIDADKENYINYFKILKEKMRPGGLIVADNVLWSGKVLDDPSEQEPSTRGICAFNDYIRSLADVEKVMLTVRDGMTLIMV